KRNIHLHHGRRSRGGRRRRDGSAGGLISRNDRLQIGSDLFEPLPARPAPGRRAGLEEVAERHEVAPLAAAVLMTVELLGWIIGLNRQCPVAGFLSLATSEKA